MPQLRERTPYAQAPALLSELLALSGAGGVLSIYVDADPGLAAGRRPAWQAPVRVAVRRLVADARRLRPREERLALEARLTDLEPELEALLDPRRPGRGRALFAAIAGGAPRLVEVRTPLPSLVALRRHAVVLPLLRVLQDGSPAGVAAVSWDRLDQAEWALGVLEPLETVELERTVTRRRRHATNPAVPQPFPERDRFETAGGARVLQQLRDAGARLADEAGGRGWDALVADGDHRLVDALVEGFGNGGRVVRSERPLGRLASTEAADVVAATLRELRHERVGELVRRLDDSSAAARDALVLDRAFDEGRVEHLLLDTPPGPRPGLRAESLVRRAYETGAEVTIVPPRAHDLGPAGAAALLRW